jgi:hypothetical protein
MALAQCVCVYPNLTPIAYHQEQHRRCLTADLLMINFLAQQRTPVAYGQSIATW